MIVVKPCLALLTFLVVFNGSNAFVKWTHLKATWCPGASTNPHCFQDIPKTAELALNNGWRKVKGSSCKNGGKFFGYRMVKNDDYSLTPLYDERGIIAGIQVNGLKSELSKMPNPYKYDEVPDYLDNSIEGHRIYSQTTYFVDTTEICNKGRSKRQLDVEGVGSRLYFQTGKSPKCLRPIPLYRKEAEKTYTSTNCVNSMGYHNHFDVPHMMQSHCTTIVPSFLLFNNHGELHGFGLTMVGKLSSPNFEHPNGFAIKQTLDPIAPECMVNIADSPTSGYSNVHFFFIEKPLDLKCAPLEQKMPVGKSVYINPNAFSKQ